MNGSLYGIPNGKNPGGPNLLALQAGVSLFAIVQNPVKTSKDFVELIRRGLAAPIGDKRCYLTSKPR